jgi:hypothetical protein
LEFLPLSVSRQRGRRLLQFSDARLLPPQNAWGKRRVCGKSSGFMRVPENPIRRLPCGFPDRLSTEKRSFPRVFLGFLWVFPVFVGFCWQYGTNWRVSAAPARLLY